MTCKYCDQPVTGDNSVTLENGGVVHDACEDLYEMFLQRRKTQSITLDEFRREPWIKDLEANGNIKTAWCGNCGSCCN